MSVRMRCKRNYWRRGVRHIRTRLVVGKTESMKKGDLPSGIPSKRRRKSNPGDYGAGRPLGDFLNRLL